jgi:hypothetical protein
LGTLLAVATGSCTETKFGETPKGKIRASISRRTLARADRVLTFGPGAQLQSLAEANSKYRPFSMVPVHELHTLGSVRLGFELEEIVNGPSEFCEVDAGVSHCERTGSEGATVLLFWKKT